MNKERLVAFTDAVLAIIMTILVLELEKPGEASLSAFWALRTNFAAYTLSFFWLGSLWIGLNSVWEKAENISTPVIWWNIVLLFFASFIPYATSLVSENFDSALMQCFYGIVVILMTGSNYFLHKVLEAPNHDNSEVVTACRTYRKMLLPDIIIKVIGLVLAFAVYPPVMMYAVLAAAVFILTAKAVSDRNNMK